MKAKAQAQKIPPMNDNLRKLEALTLKLAPVSIVPGVVQYDVVGHGPPVIARALMKDERVAVQVAYCSAGETIVEHLHDEIEWLVVYRGKIRANFANGRTQIVGTGHAIRFDPGEIHTVTALVNTELIGITIPASPEYPDV